MTDPRGTSEDDLRFAIEDAVVRALEAGWSKRKVREEVEFQIDNFEGEAGSHD